MVPDHEALKVMCRKIAYWLTNTDAKPGLILAGFPGTGKTTLLDAIGKILRTSSFESKYYIATDLPLPLVDTPETYRDSVLHGKWATFLLLDDVGEEPVEVKDFGRSLPLFTKIVAERYRLMLPIVMTTNLNMQQIEERYGARTADRLREMADVIIFNNSSYRR